MLFSVDVEFVMLVSSRELIMAVQGIPTKIESVKNTIIKDFLYI